MFVVELKNNCPSVIIDAVGGATLNSSVTVPPATGPGAPPKTTAEVESDSLLPPPKEFLPVAKSPIS